MNYTDEILISIQIYRRLGLLLYKYVRSLARTPKLEVLHQSSNFIVLNKEYDVLINSNDPRKTSSLHYRLTKEFPQLANPKLKHHFYFVHRLDYATSGVLCVALNKKACAAATTSFEKRLANKFYLAMLRGHVNGEFVKITNPVGEDASEKCKSNKMTIQGDERCVNSRSALTGLLVLERGFYDGYPASKVLLTPFTGRRHQLRVHCAHIGHTVIGDFTYSRKRDTRPPRTHLHAFKLTLPNEVESLEIQTTDPFADLKGWVRVEIINKIDQSAFAKLSKLTGG